MARKVVPAAGWFLTCLDALEAAAKASLRGPFADLAAALESLGGLAARGSGERLGLAGRLLRGCVPAPLVAARGHLRSPSDPRLAASRRQVFSLARKTLGELLGRLELPAAGAPHGALSWWLWQLREMLAAPRPDRLRGDLDAPLAALVWHSAARCWSCAAPAPSAWTPNNGPPGMGEGSQEPERCAVLRAAAEDLSQGVRTGLLRQILDTFTDTQSPLLSLVRAALATRPGSSGCDVKASPPSLQLLAAFRAQAKRMLRVAHFVLVCCPRQRTGQDMEATIAGLWGLAVRVQQFFSQSPQGSGLDRSPAALQALLKEWVRASEGLLACFDDVLNIPEFLSVSIQEMTKHLDFFTWALRSGDPREFAPFVAYLQGLATHIVQVMSRFVDRDRDPIFRNGLRVLIQQLEQSSWVLGAATQCYSGGHGPQDPDALVTAAKHVISSVQSIQEGLDGTNHPDILSPLQDRVQGFDMAKREPYFILPSLQDESRSHHGRTSTPTILQEWDGAVDAAQEAVAGGTMGSERMTGLQEIPLLAPPIITQAREIEHSTTARTGRLLEVALQGSGKTREIRQGLAATVEWYSLCQQLFCNNSDLQENVTVFMELQQNLASVVQLAAKSGPMDLRKKDSVFTGHPEASLQAQGRLEEAETRAKQLLDKVLASDGFQTPRSWEESIEDECLLWSVAVQDLLQGLEKLSRRLGLFLWPLRQAVGDQQGLQEGLAQAADVSQRLREAARLSCLLCADEQVKGKIFFLCGKVHVFTDTLLDVAQILASSPKPSPSLSTRFELLCLELTLQARALTGRLSSINTVYEHASEMPSAQGSLSAETPQTQPENSLQRMVSGIQAVQGIMAGGQELGSCQEDLLLALENILVLTKEVAQWVSMLQGHPEDWLQQEWAAKAHHTVTQIWAWKGGHTKAWKLLAQCLKPSDEQDPAQVHSTMGQVHPEALKPAV
ncbi:LOW QUALITY PROTEIN: uncharacterized protein ACBT57_018777 [Dama dama]